MTEINRTLTPTIQGLRGQPQWEGGVPGAGGDHLPGVQDIERDVTGATQSPALSVLSADLQQSINTTQREAKKGKIRDMICKMKYVR